MHAMGKIKNAKMGKIMDKVRHNYNAFLKLQTMFFSQTMRHLVLSARVQTIS